MSEFVPAPGFADELERRAQLAAMSGAAIVLGRVGELLANEPERTGRLYEKRTGRSGRLYLYPISEAGTSELGVGISAGAYRRRRRRTRNTKGNLAKRRVRLHRASRLGEPPALLTGRLRASRAARAAHRRGMAIVDIGSNVAYAKRHEREGRIAWARALVETWPTVERVIASEMARG